MRTTMMIHLGNCLSLRNFVDPVGSAISNRRKSESGMTLVAVLGVMAVFAMALLAVAPSVNLDVQRERELESIRRGEEVANAIQQYVTFYRGSKLPTSIDELLEGLPQGTKKRQILRPSAATDPLSEDGKWLLVPPDPQVIASFAKRVQEFNYGLLPSNPTRFLDRYSIVLVNTVNTGSETSPDDENFTLDTDSKPFIGVVSQSTRQSVLTYYGADNHSKWYFSPLFRGSGVSITRPTRPQQGGGITR